ncbi:MULTISPECIES: hypothetical protein [unclassified Nocardioides]|uniref:hypothetical protein n=1 Tax=unclassified Nocardioides TaxID=2615069 RepID=UPI0036152B97
MRMEWLPVSAALLLTGALALALGTFLLPSSDGAAEALRVVQDNGGAWMASAAIYFLASVCLTLGLPAIVVLFERRGRVLGLISAAVLEFGFIGIAGYAMLMVFFRALVETDTIVGRGLDEVVQDAGLRVFLYGWILGFVVGELLLGVALLRARPVPRWIALALVLHALAVGVSGILPEWVGKATILLFVVGMAGIAMQATAPARRVRVW